MATDEINYISYAEAVLIHIRLMQALGETRYGVDFRELIESALHRPQHAAIYESADIIRQSATLLFGLIKNHPWTIAEQIELVLAVESDKWKVDEIESWLRERAKFSDGRNLNT